MTPEEVLQLPAVELTTHRPPALLVDRPLAITPQGGRVAVAAHDGLDALQLCETAAQGLAVLMGCELRLRDADRARGMLVGLKDVAIRRVARPGEDLVVEADRTCSLGSLQLYNATVRGAAGEKLLTGEVKIYSAQAMEHPL